ncbi:MAG: hypothetical protein C0404_05895 [Verrucomicrobia bacterium]|nr:hypothetical protein [Verrucomicrobiota bacterium]
MSIGFRMQSCFSGHRTLKQGARMKTGKLWFVGLGGLFCLVAVRGTIGGAGDDLVVDEKPLAQLMKQLRSENRGIQLRAAQSIAKATAELQPKIVPQLIPVLKSERENDRFVAAQVLGDFGPVARASVPDLLPMLEGTQYERNRAAAAKALGQILKDATPSDEVENVTARLVSVFRDKYPDVQREATKACGMIGPAAKSCIPKLQEPLEFNMGNTQEDFPYRGVRGATAWTLGRMGPLASGYVDRLISQMQSEWMCMPEFVEAIGKIGAIHANVVPNIANKIEKGNWWDNTEFKEKALDALATLGAKSAPAVPLLERYLKEQTFPAGMTVRILKTLQAIGPSAAGIKPVLKEYSELPKYREGSAEDLAAIRKAAAAALAAVEAKP